MDTGNLRGLLHNFITYLQKQNKSSFTCVAYKKDIEQFVGYLTSREISDVKDVKKDHIEGFINKLVTGGYTKKSASRKLNSIRTFFRFLKGQDLIEENVAFDVAHPKYQQNAPRILSRLEYRGLRDAAKTNTRTYTMVELLLQTGIRIGELASIKLADIDGPGLRVNSRVIPLNKTVRKTIDQYMQNRHKSVGDHLFVTKTGRPLLLRNIRAIIDKCFKEIDVLDATVNDLRNTFIAYQLSKGASVSYLSKIVGHKRISSTERYLRHISEKPAHRQTLEEP